MDVVAPESPNSSGVDTLSGVESKKQRMQTGQDSGDFSSRYHLLEQLGSGASGTVWKCCLANAGRGPGAADGPLPGVIYAAKIIDLRPFKLRERFSMQRLMREVHIMQRLRHPNIIRLVEALDTPEQLVLILEYAPGVELFDAILSKTSFSEEEARPVFVQVARALQYMHSKQIVHRDVKPENVMIIDRPAEDGLYPEAKLLDFGLSKAIDSDMGGSVARTFVGTPSYLAPEVEERTAGKGKPYGTPVDCWSLGAMLYVMLVARFPEFQLQGTRKNVRMHGALWDKVSTEAKELIKHLMAFDAGARLTVEQALRHPWLKELAAKDPPRSPQPRAPTTSGMQGIPPVPEGVAFSVSAGVRVMEPEEQGASGTGSSSSFSSPRSQPRQQRRSNNGGGGSSGAWGGRLPVVTEQPTPPSAITHKSYDVSPTGTHTGPKIRELNSDEPSLDHSMGEIRTNELQPNSNQNVKKEASPGTNAGHRSDGGRGASPNLTRGKSMQGEERTRNETAMVTTNSDLQEIGLTRTPPDGNVPLLQLQERITAVMETAVETYSDCPEGAASLRRSAALCRESLRESVTLLRKIEKTAAQVITLFPDLTLAVEEGEPDLAHDFFSTVKTWVREMYTAVSVVQANNSSNADEVGKAMKKHAEMGLRGQRIREDEQERKQQQQQERKQEQQQERKQEQQEQQRQEQQQQRGGTAYVARAVDGNVELGAGSQGDHLISVDAQTFEVVRQIQQLRDSLGRNNNVISNNNNPSSTNTDSSMEDTSTTSVPASEAGTEASDANSNSVGTTAKATTTTAKATAADGATASATAADGSTATATSTASGTAEAAAGGNPGEMMSEEKLINLFLLMAGRGQDWPRGNSSTGGNGTSGGVTSGDGAETDSAGGNGGGPKEGLSEEGGRGAARGGQQPADPDMDMDAAVAGFAAKMSIDASLDAPISVEGGGLPPHAGEDKRGSWKGAMHLARLNEEKIYSEVQQALQMLQEVDSVLEQLALFWANSEVIFEVLLRKGDLVEKFVAFANKPRLLHRFRERLADYKRFWEGVQNVCNKYVSGQGKGEGGEAASRTNSNGTPRARSGSQWGEGVGTAYDGSYSASSNRSNSSQSSAGSQADAPDVSDVPTQEGLGGGGYGRA